MRLRRLLVIAVCLWAQSAVGQAGSDADHTTERDALGRPIRQGLGTQGDPARWRAGRQLGYDDEGRLATLTYHDGSQLAVSAFHPVFQTPTEITLPNGSGQISLGYNAAGQVTSRRVRFGGFDLQDSFTLDALNRPTSASGEDQSIRWTYNAQGVMTSQDATLFGRRYETQVEPYEDGSLRRLRYPSGAVATYERAPSGRLTSLTLTDAGSTTTLVDQVAYAAASAFSELTLGGEIKREDRYDSRGRLLSRKYARGADDIAEYR